MTSKVIEEARRLGLEVDVRRLDTSTRTVADAANAVGCREGEIAKSLVFVADGDPVLCITSGSHRVDLDKLAVALDVAEVRQAEAAEVRAATGYPIGGVPPVGHGLTVVFDRELLAHERIWAAAGDAQSLFCADPRELAERTRAQVADVGD